MKKNIQNTFDVVRVKSLIVRDYQSKLDKLSRKPITPEIREQLAFLKERIEYWKSEVTRFKMIAKRQSEVTVIQ